MDEKEWINVTVEVCNQHTPQVTSTEQGQLITENIGFIKFRRDDDVIISYPWHRISKVEYRKVETTIVDDNDQFRV